jgi:hypothetical protein
VTLPSARGRAGAAAAPPEGLAHRLRRAGSSELRRLTADHLRELTLREVRQILLNPYVTAEVIEELVLARHLLSGYAMRQALARHRRTPEAAALRFLPGLFWRDLLEITLDVCLRPAVRRSAEKYLVQRLPALAVGEKVSLARRASATVIAELRRDPSPRVVTALLDNPRLTEQLLTPLAVRSTSPRVLDLVAQSARWGRLYEIRAALARNVASPFRAVFAILPTLRRDDVAALAADEQQSTVVRNRAAEVLAAWSRPKIDPPPGEG